MKFVPRIYQEYGRRYLVKHRRTAGLIDMGLGKTVMVLNAFLDLQAGLEIKSMLVLAPIRVCESVWPDEIMKWDHTKHMTWSLIRGSPVSRELTRSATDILLGLKGRDRSETFMSKPSAKAMAEIAKPVDVCLTNYENLPAICQWMHKKKELPWDMIVFDESTKMKSHSARRFKLLKPYLGKFKRWAILTGTPMPQSYIDLWAQFYLLDRGEALSDRFTHFRDRWFTYNPWSYETKMNPGADVEIRKRISPMVVCLRSKDWLTLPPIIHSRIVIDLPPALRKRYAEFEKELYLKLTTIEVEAFGAAGLAIKCRQFTSGSMYETPKPGTQIAGTTKQWEAIHDLKLEAVNEIVESAQGDQVLIVYEFKHELARLLRLFPKAPWIGGGSKNSIGVIRDWNAKKFPVMLVHPDSVGHGVNLQHGGRRLVWTSMTYNADAYEQMIKRLHRQGQTRPVLVHRIVCRNTVDEEVEAIVDRKIRGQNAFLQALKTRCISNGNVLAAHTALVH